MLDWIKEQLHQASNEWRRLKKEWAVWSDAFKNAKVKNKRGFLHSWVNRWDEAGKVSYYISGHMLAIGAPIFVVETIYLIVR